MNRAAQQLGRLGGKVKSPSKARTSEQARAAAKARWDKVRAQIVLAKCVACGRLVVAGTGSCGFCDAVAQETFLKRNNKP